MLTSKQQETVALFHRLVTVAERAGMPPPIVTLMRSILDDIERTPDIAAERIAALTDLYERMGSGMDLATFVTLSEQAEGRGALSFADYSSPTEIAPMGPMDMDAFIMQLPRFLPPTIQMVMHNGNWALSHPTLSPTEARPLIEAALQQAAAAVGATVDKVMTIPSGIPGVVINTKEGKNRATHTWHHTTLGDLFQLIVEGGATESSLRGEPVPPPTTLSKGARRLRAQLVAAVEQEARGIFEHVEKTLGQNAHRPPTA